MHYVKFTLVTANIWFCMSAPGIVQWIISACENEMMRDYSEIIAGSGVSMPPFSWYHTTTKVPQASFPSSAHALSLHSWPVHLPHACFDAVVLRIVCENTPYKHPISPSELFCTHTLCYHTLADFIALQGL